MKKTMIITALFAAAIGLTACSDNDTTIGYAPSETVTLSTRSLTVGKDGGTLTASVTSSHEFSIYSADTWLTVSPTNSVGKTATLTITAAENTGAARTGHIVVWTGGSRDSIAVAQEAGEQNIEAPIAGYSLVWNDEFTGSKLSGDWTYEVQPAGWVNNELQNYVEEDHVAQVAGGTLKINLVNDGGTIKSARLYARKSSGWMYGYIEARIKLPQGKGTWPAFWMMPVNFNNDWPSSGEIDIMEAVGYQPNRVWSTIHCNKYNNGGTATESANMSISDLYADFHTYGLEWTDSYMTFYVDGAKLLTYANDGTGHDAWPFNAAFYPILNLAWGGSWGGAQGVDESVLPATMEVDYVRVFQKN